MKYDLEYFLEQAKKIHGNKYDYSNVKIKNWKTKVSIVCPIHGLFLQSPAQHITRGCGCSLCRWDKRSQTCIKKYGVPHPLASPDIITQHIREKAKTKAKEAITVLKKRVLELSTLFFV